MSKKVYLCKFRFRCYYCKKCDIHIQFSGNDPVVGHCRCGEPISSLHLESDAIIDSHKTVKHHCGDIENL